MRPKLLLLLLGTGLLSAVAPPAVTGTYYAYGSMGAHTWHQLLKINGPTFRSTRWQTGFMRPTTSVTTGEVRRAGDTLVLQPIRVRSYVRRRKAALGTLRATWLKLTRRYDHRTTCLCRDVATFDSQTDPVKTYLCYQPQKLLPRADSLLEPGTKIVYLKQP